MLIEPQSGPENNILKGAEKGKRTALNAYAYASACARQGSRHARTHIFPWLHTHTTETLAHNTKSEQPTCSSARQAPWTAASTGLHPCVQSHKRSLSEHCLCPGTSSCSSPWMWGGLRHSRGTPCTLWGCLARVIAPPELQLLRDCLLLLLRPETCTGMSLWDADQDTTLAIDWGYIC